jgi:Bifunctional DNA primase/polymerase, N-terminal
MEWDANRRGQQCQVTTAMVEDFKRRQEIHHPPRETADQQDIGPRQEADTPNSVGSGGVSEGVFARAYPLYDRREWPNSLKLPRGEKWPPPKGFTGRDGATPSAEQKAQWAREEPDGNIAQRLPETCIGIDVDHYGHKRGGDTLTEAEKRWGPLPPTYVSTSRPDGVSGIRIYRIPEAFKLNGNIAFPDLGLGDIEIIQNHHRYMVCSPSIHPDTGNRYDWYEPGYSPEHIVKADEPPNLSTAAKLPEAWIDGLQEKPKSANNKGGRAAEEEWPEIPYVVEQSL